MLISRRQRDISRPSSATARKEPISMMRGLAGILFLARAPARCKHDEREEARSAPGDFRHGADC